MPRTITGLTTTATMGPTKVETAPEDLDPAEVVPEPEPDPEDAA